MTAQNYGDGSYMIKTSSYTVLHQNNGFVLIDTNDNVYVYGSNVNIIGQSDVNINAGENLNIFTKNKFKIANSSNISFYQILKDTLNVLNQSLATQGSPAAHTVIPGQFSTQISQLDNLME